jgi:hypothetical protein
MFNLANMMGGFGAFAPYFVLFVIWNLFWKGLALWHSAKRQQGWWFVALLILNTAGILEIIYLFAIAKVKSQELFK